MVVSFPAFFVLICLVLRVHVLVIFRSGDLRSVWRFLVGIRRGEHEQERSLRTQRFLFQVRPLRRVRVDQSEFSEFFGSGFQHFFHFILVFWLLEGHSFLSFLPL